MKRTNNRRELYESGVNSSFALYVTKAIGYILVMLVIIYGIELMGLAQTLHYLNPLVTMIGL